MSNLTLIASKSLHNESLTDALTERQSLLMCVSSFSPVQPSSTEELRTLLLEAFPANHSQLPESKQAQTMPEICGLQQPTLFAQSDLPAFSWKTYRDYCSSTTQKVFSLTLPKWGMWDATGLYPQPMWEPDTDGNDCGSLENWATPQAFDGRELDKTEQTIQKRLNGGHLPSSLGDQVKYGKNWPSITCSDGYTGNLKSTQQKPGSMHSVTLPQAVAMWPRPDAKMGARGTQPEWKPVRDSGHTATYTINQAVRDKIADQKSRMEEIFKNRKTTPATADFDIIAPNDEIKTWPTPTAHLAKETGAPSEYDRNEPSITSRVFNGDERNGMALNPDWVSWLMGWPIGWADVKPLVELDWRDWSVDPADIGEISRVTNVKENRANQLKALGNGQVPQCVVKAWELLS